MEKPNIHLFMNNSKTGNPQNGNSQLLTYLTIASLAVGLITSGLLIYFNLEKIFLSPRSDLSVIVDYDYINVSEKAIFIQIGGVLSNEVERATVITIIEVLYHFPSQYPGDEFILSRRMPASIQNINKRQLKVHDTSNFIIIDQIYNYEIEHFNYTCKDVLRISTKFIHNDGLGDMMNHQFFEKNTFYYND